MARKVPGAHCLRTLGVQIFTRVGLAGRRYTMATAHAKAAVARAAGTVMGGLGHTLVPEQSVTRGDLPR